MFFFLFSLFAAAFLWFFTFVVKPFDFWFMMAFNGFALISLAFFSRKAVFDRQDITFKNFFVGVVSALILYGIFFIGRQILYFLPFETEYLHSIYANGSNTPRAVVAGLLFFPIGFAEEFFWRGYIQNKLYDAYAKFPAFVLASVFYIAVHIPTFNPVLILAAAVCGFYWGFLYLITGSLFAVLVSHMLWDPLIFVLKPIY